MGDLYDTRGQAERGRMAFWLETVCAQILPVRIDPRHDSVPRAALASNRLGALQMRRVVGGDHVYARGERELRQGDPDTLQIGMPRGGGSILVQDGREAVLKPGDMVVYDTCSTTRALRQRPAVHARHGGALQLAGLPPSQGHAPQV